MAKKTDTKPEPKPAPPPPPEPVADATISVDPATVEGVRGAAVNIGGQVAARELERSVEVSVALYLGDARVGMLVPLTAVCLQPGKPLDLARLAAGPVEIGPRPAGAYRAVVQVNPTALSPGDFWRVFAEAPLTVTAPPEKES